MQRDEVAQWYLIQGNSMVRNRIAANAAKTFVVGVSLLVADPAFATGTERSRCFNFDELTPDLRAKSEAHLLKALDTEHLFTLVSGLKPMSAGFYSTRMLMSGDPHMTDAEAANVLSEIGNKNVSELDEQSAQRLESAKGLTERARARQEIEDLRTILSTWRCGGQIHAELVHYATPREGARLLHGVIFAMPAFADKLKDKAPFFSRWALTPNASPLEVLMAVEYARDVSRSAGYGYLFGYPDPAVQFFAAASASEDTTGEFVERDFRAIPTFQRDTGQFTYAVAKGAEETDIDRDLKARAGAVLDAYKARRERFIGDGKAGAAALLRDWFCPTEDLCSPADAVL